MLSANKNKYGILYRLNQLDDNVFDNSLGFINIDLGMQIYKFILKVQVFSLLSF